MNRKLIASKDKIGPWGILNLLSFYYRKCIERRKLLRHASKEGEINVMSFKLLIYP